MRADAYALRRHAAKNRLLILNIHSVSPRYNPYAPSLDPRLFGQLLTWMQAHVTVCLLRDLPDPPQHDPRRPLAVLSFDDGLKDFVEYAMPLLRDFGMAASQNVIGQAIETGQPPWTIGLLDQLSAAPVGLVQGLRLGGFAYRLASADAYAKERFGAAITNHLKSLPPVDRDPLLRTLEHALRDVVVERPTLMMSAADVAAARAAGHEIGSHSYSHESMQHLDDDAFLTDFRRSRDVLASAGCDRCDVYAFPNGSNRPGQAEILQRHGVRHVLLVDERPSEPDAGVHTRITVRGGSSAELRARATLSPSPVGRSRARSRS